jgi:hypothetical protein
MEDRNHAWTEREGKRQGKEIRKGWIESISYS